LPKPKIVYKTVKAGGAMTSGAYRTNYTHINFIKVFVKVMDLSEAFLSFGILASAGFSLGALFTFHLKVFSFVNSCHLFTPLKNSVTQSQLLLPLLVFAGGGGTFEAHQTDCEGKVSGV